MLYDEGDAPTTVTQWMDQRERMHVYDLLRDRCNRVLRAAGWPPIFRWDSAYFIETNTSDAEWTEVRTLMAADDSTDPLSFRLHVEFERKHSLPGERAESIARITLDAYVTHVALLSRWWRHAPVHAVFRALRRALA